MKTASIQTKTGKVELTHARHLRTHGKKARGTGWWLLQQTTNRTAFDGELAGDVHSFHCMVGELATLARAAGLRGLFAILD